jgi:hypothetical protein
MWLCQADMDVTSHALNHMTRHLTAKEAFHSLIRSYKVT